VWDDPERAQALGRERSDLETVVKTIADLSDGCDDSLELLQLAAEEDDAAAVSDIEAEIQGLMRQLEKLEFRRMRTTRLIPCL